MLNDDQQDRNAAEQQHGQDEDEGLNQQLRRPQLQDPTDGEGVVLEQHVLPAQDDGDNATAGGATQQPQRPHSGENTAPLRMSDGSSPPVSALMTDGDQQGSTPHDEATLLTSLSEILRDSQAVGMSNARNEERLGRYTGVGGSQEYLDHGESYPEAMESLMPPMTQHFHDQSLSDNELVDRRAVFSASAPAA